MAAGDQLRSAAVRAKEQAQSNRVQAKKMRDSAVLLENDSRRLEIEAAQLERQARDTDDAEKRAQASLNQIGVSI